MSKEKSTYKMVYFCLNCRKKKWKEFPFGEFARSIDGEDICDYCGYDYFSDAFHPDSKKVEDWDG